MATFVDAQRPALERVNYIYFKENFHLLSVIGVLTRDLTKKNSLGNPVCHHLALSLHEAGI